MTVLRLPLVKTLLAHSSNIVMGFHDSPLRKFTLMTPIRSSRLRDRSILNISHTTAESQYWVLYELPCYRLSDGIECQPSWLCITLEAACRLNDYASWHMESQCLPLYSSHASSMISNRNLFFANTTFAVNKSYWVPPGYSPATLFWIYVRMVIFSTHNVWRFIFCVDEDERNFCYFVDNAISRRYAFISSIYLRKCICVSGPRYAAGCLPIKAGILSALRSAQTKPETAFHF